MIERGVTSALTDNVAIIASAQKISPLNSWTLFTGPWKVRIGLSRRTPLSANSVQSQHFQSNITNNRFAALNSSAEWLYDDNTLCMHTCSQACMHACQNVNTAAGHWGAKELPFSNILLENCYGPHVPVSTAPGLFLLLKRRK